MLFPIFGAHVSDTEFQYPDHIWKELCFMMAYLVADSGCIKGHLSILVEAICRVFRLQDEAEENKFLEWQKRLRNRARTCTCRLLEPTLVHSRVPHVQTPEAAKRDREN